MGLGRWSDALLSEVGPGLERAVGDRGRGLKGVMEAGRPVPALRGRHGADQRGVKQGETGRVGAARDWGGRRAGHLIEGSTLNPKERALNGAEWKAGREAIQGNGKGSANGDTRAWPLKAALPLDLWT